MIGANGEKEDDTILEARAVSFSFSRPSLWRALSANRSLQACPVLDCVSFRLRSGEVVSLLGSNGAGKTTLLRLLLGFEKPDRGQVLLNGVPLDRQARRAIAQLVAYIPQSHAPAFPYRVRDVVLLGRTAAVGLFRPFRTEDREAAERALGSLGLARLADRPYTELSGGERQLVLIARALAQGSRLIVMDEPFASIDYGQTVRLAERLRALARRGAGILLTTHDPGQAMRVSSRAALLAGARIVADGPPEEVLSPAAIESLYGLGARAVSGQ